MSDLSNTAAPTRRIFSVSELNTETKALLETRFMSVFVQGEVSNFSAPRSGHWYFTLKDADAQLRIVMFKNMNIRIAAPKLGDEVVVNGQLSFYKERGEVQIIARQLRAAGLGDLQAQFDALKEKLAAEGLFNPTRKRALPHLPKHIAVITSATGSVIQDIIQVTRRRAPAMRISVLPVAVQGDTAVESICNALSQTQQLGHFDAVLIARGGGSLEDLAAFNSEPVARAIASHHSPVVSAIGHETDISIADFIADKRAATPSEGAELLTANYTKVSEHVKQCHSDLKMLMRASIDRKRNTTHILSLRLIDPRAKLREISQRADGLEARLTTALHHRLHHQKSQVQMVTQRLDSRVLTHQITDHHRRIKRIQHQLITALTLARQTVENDFRHQVTLLNTLNPLNTLARGYAVVTAEEKAVITSIGHSKVGQNICVQLQDGSLTASVEAIESRKNN